APRVTTVPHCDAGCRKPSTTPWSRSSDFLTRVLVHGLSMQSPSPPEWSSRHSVVVDPKGEGHVHGRTLSPVVGRGMWTFGFGWARITQRSCPVRRSCDFGCLSWSYREVVGAFTRVQPRCVETRPRSKRPGRTPCPDRLRAPQEPVNRPCVRSGHYP